MKLPYAPVEFTSSGEVADASAVQQALELARTAHSGEASDILLVAHGWNNGMTEAEALIEELTDNLTDRARARTRREPPYVVIGLLWPSMRWADTDELAGGGLSAGGDAAALLDAVDQRVEDPATAALLKQLALSVDTSEVARDQFIDTLRTLLPNPDQVADDDPIPAALLSRPPSELLDSAAEAETDIADAAEASVAFSGLPPGVPPDFLDASATTASGLGLSDLKPSLLIRRLLNLTTYYTMKDRAGKVGVRGVAPLLEELNTQPGGRGVHLAGHSFGGRVVTAAVGQTRTPVSSVALLQAAFSHTAFSATFDPPGAFRHVLDGRVMGPMLITHTHNDRAVGRAYALASRLARQIGSDLGDANDPYGGLGANGAVATQGVVQAELGTENENYAFSAGTVHNLLADKRIRNHGDVRNPAVANAWLQAVEAARA
jgi:pimeloyl-ACP methyl ester carboxylesterase